MAQCEAQIFSGITPEQFARLTEKARAAGLELSGQNGTAAKFGVKVAWNYSPETGRLAIQCTGTPFFIGCQDVNEKIQEWVKESAG